jgi:hypothetical protein
MKKKKPPSSSSSSNLFLYNLDITISIHTSQPSTTLHKIFPKTFGTYYQNPLSLHPILQERSGDSGKTAKLLPMYYQHAPAQSNQLHPNTLHLPLISLTFRQRDSTTLIPFFLFFNKLRDKWMINK